MQLNRNAIPRPWHYCKTKILKKFKLYKQEAKVRHLVETLDNYTGHTPVLCKVYLSEETLHITCIKASEVNSGFSQPLLDFKIQIGRPVYP